jgi:hypothetical protein
MEKHIKQQIKIEKLNQNKQKLIDSKVLLLKPLEAKQKELKHQIDPLKACINKLKLSLNTLEDVNCEEKENISLLQKANAEEEKLL